MNQDYYPELRKSFGFAECAAIFFFVVSLIGWVPLGGLCIQVFELWNESADHDIGDAGIGVVFVSMFVLGISFVLFLLTALASFFSKELSLAFRFISVIPSAAGFLAGLIFLSI